ncbi:heat shock protein GrpE [bacterium BMS3Bbin10]|nr:heat shock protein GrpE [bacterium BMS3Bbin10]
MSEDKTGKTSQGDAARDGAPEQAPPPEAGPADTGAGSSEGSGWARGELESLKEENAALKDRLLRTAAEMENLRRRTERDKADTAKYAISNFARDMLSIGDNIARAIEHVPEEAAEKDPALKSFLEGMQVTERELLNVMERHGIARLDPKGERFDPNKHQAMFEVEDKDVPEGTIVKVVQAGYVIADRVLRPALVGVAKGGAKPAKAEAEPPQAANDDTAKPEPAPQGAGDGKAKKSGGKSRKGVGGKVDKSA